jgi:hypothetical protein
MKKIAYLILAAVMVMSFSSFVFADDFQVLGREIYPGTNVGDRVVGALFVGKFYDGGFANERGRFSIILDNDGQDVELCEGRTELLRFKLIMNFDSGARLVLVGPIGGDVYAEWDWDTLLCPSGNCPLTDYTDYITLFTMADPETALLPCAAEGAEPTGKSFIAEVPQFDVSKQFFGSYGTRYRRGTVSGWLVHTPIVSPAIFGTVSVSR